MFQLHKAATNGPYVSKNVITPSDGGYFLIHTA